MLSFYWNLDPNLKSESKNDTGKSLLENLLVLSNKSSLAFLLVLCKIMSLSILPASLYLVGDAVLLLGDLVSLCLVEDPVLEPVLLLASGVQVAS